MVPVEESRVGSGKFVMRGGINPKTVHCFGMLENCSFVWNSEKGKCVLVKKTCCNSPAYAWPKLTSHVKSSTTFITGQGLDGLEAALLFHITCLTS